MSIVTWIVLGLVSGFIASKIVNRTGAGALLDIVFGVVGAVVGEWVGSTHGLGYLMLHFENRGETAGLFATVAVLTFMGIILFFLVGWAENWAISWTRYAKETL